MRNVLVGGALLIALGAFARSAQAAPGRLLVVPTAYATIQKAIDASVSGDTIQVKAGTYGGSTVANHPRITIMTSEGAKIVSAASGFTVSNSDGVTITGFDLSGTVGLAEVVVSQSQGVTVAKCTIHDVGPGIGAVDVEGSPAFHLTHCEAYRVGEGVFCSLSGQSEIEQSYFHDLGLFGIGAVGSDGVHIHHNTVSRVAIGGGPVGHGITVGSGNGYHVDHNAVDHVPTGAGFGLGLDSLSEVDHNTASICQAGIECASNGSSEIDHNQVSQNTFAGLVIADSDRLMVDHNQAAQNGEGIHARNDTNSTFSDNDARTNQAVDLRYSQAATGDVFRNNHANTATPSLAFWDAH